MKHALETRERGVSGRWRSPWWLPRLSFRPVRSVLREWQDRRGLSALRLVLAPPRQQTRRLHQLCELAVGARQGGEGGADLLLHGGRPVAEALGGAGGHGGEATEDMVDVDAFPAHRAEALQPVEGRGEQDGLVRRPGGILAKDPGADVALDVAVGDGAGGLPPGPAAGRRVTDLF